MQISGGGDVITQSLADVCFRLEQSVRHMDFDIEFWRFHVEYQAFRST